MTVAASLSARLWPALKGAGLSALVAFGLFLMAFRRMTDAEASGAALG